MTNEPAPQTEPRGDDPAAPHAAPVWHEVRERPADPDESTFTHDDRERVAAALRGCVAKPPPDWRRIARARKWRRARGAIEPPAH